MIGNMGNAFQPFIGRWIIDSFGWNPLFIVLAIAYFVAASHRVRLGPRRRGTLLVAVGSILVAVGVGLAPHLVKNGVAVRNEPAGTMLSPSRPSTALVGTLTR